MHPVYHRILYPCNNATYNRSDSSYLNDDQHSEAPEVLKAISRTSSILSKAALAGDTQIKSRAFNSKNVSAHHAIIPTAAVKNLNNINADEAKIYQLIARAYIAQFYPKYQYKQTIIDIDISGYLFHTTSNVMVRNGWKALYTNDVGNDEINQVSECKDDLEWVVANSKLDCDNAYIEAKATKPLPLYTMSALLKDLTRVSKYVKDPRIKKLLLDKDKGVKGEHGGIGTAATRSAIIEQLFKRGFIEEKSKKVRSTVLGNTFFDQLPEIATLPDLTALWHEQLEQVRAETMSVTEFVQGVETHIDAEIERVKNTTVTQIVPTGPKWVSLHKRTVCNVAIYL
ncbi:MAG: hypothetical protein HRU28_01460 [Rhizobiales bacterium]|nr:hypothetical protein [Hyphomicrobiales bacterium]